MKNEDSFRRYKRLYAKLLKFHSKPFRDRFGNGMEQTFKDLLRDRAEDGRGHFLYAVWLLTETGFGIVLERVTLLFEHIRPRRLVAWAIVVGLLLLIPFVAMHFTSEVNWDLFDFVFMGCLLMGVGLSFELVLGRSQKTVYRVAFGVGLGTAFLLVWINGAVGIIGSEGNPANLMYGTVLATGLVGSLIARFKPNGMANTCFIAALVQLLAPVISLLIWSPISWGTAGVIGVFLFNAIFAFLFIVSGILFRRSIHANRRMRSDL